jgi:BMFP domain-containing protein YqiC
MGTCNEEQNSSLDVTSKGCCQYDSSQIIYRLDSNELSKLSFLGIGRGDSLELIVEKLGKHILESNPNFVESFGYDQKTLPALFDFILNKLDLIERKSDTNNILLNSINDKLVVLTDRVNTIEKPNLLDSKGIGFTKNDKIQTVIQKIIDNGL